jgi:hypothetical protein
MTMKNGNLIIALTAAVLLQSCAREDVLRTEGLTLGAGDAMARNTALQVVDPWPNGVEDTDLLIPNSRPKNKIDGETKPVAPAPTPNP